MSISRNRNEVIKEAVLFVLESMLFTFSVFGSRVIENCLGINKVVEVSVQCCIIAFYIIRMWGSEELKERPFDSKAFAAALIPVFLIVALNGFRIQKGFSLTTVLLCLITAACEELHFRVNGCHLFREDGFLGYADCIILVLVYSVCHIISFIAEGVLLTWMSVLESVADGVLLLGFYLKTGNTKSVVLLHLLLLIVEESVFKVDIPTSELVNVVVSTVIGVCFFRKSVVAK